MLVDANVPLLPQNNDLLREIFGLGPPLVLDAATLKTSKVSRFEKVGAPHPGSCLHTCPTLLRATAKCLSVSGR